MWRSLDRQDGERTNGVMENKDFMKKKELFIEQKRTLDIFLDNGAITKAQYNKSYGDLVKLMGMEEVAKKLESEDK